MANSANCPLCGTPLPMATAADREAAESHARNCARNGNGREVVQAAPVKKSIPRPEIK